MSDPQPEDVSNLLTDADRTARGLLTGDAESDDLLEHAEAAADLLESADPVGLLEAVGLETLPDGSEPSSIPDAIARGDEARVDELQRLLHLANLADGDRDGETDEHESGDETAVEDLEASVAAVRETGAHERVDDGADEGGAVDGDDDGDAADDDADATGGNGDADAESTIESAVRSTLEEVDADLEGLRDRLEAVATTDDDSGDGSTGDGDEGDGSRGEVEDEDDEQDAEADDGLLESGLDPDLGSGDGIGSGPSSGRGVARHSTVAASPSDRPDMRGLARFSTVPKRD